jgi:hypothetical protein
MKLGVPLMGYGLQIARRGSVVSGAGFTRKS